MKCIVQRYIEKQKAIDPGFSVNRFSIMAGVSRQLLSWHSKNPDKAWSMEKALKIEIATNSEIKAGELMGG